MIYLDIIFYLRNILFHSIRHSESSWECYFLDFWKAWRQFRCKYNVNMISIENKNYVVIRDNIKYIATIIKYYRHLTFIVEISHHNNEALQRIWLQCSVYNGHTQLKCNATHQAIVMKRNNKSLLWQNVREITTPVYILFN